LQLILFDCERAWAMTMELKEYVRDEPRKQHHMIKRLRKAAELAQQLNTLCQIDTRTDLDVKAYAATMQGLLAVEERAWSDGLKHLTLAKCIYEHMANTGTAYQENLCQAAIDQIEPSIRLCTYHLRLRQDVASSVQDQVEEQVKTLPTLTATTPKTVYATLEWRSETVEVEPALEAALAKARKAMAEFQQSVDEQQDKHASNDIAVRYEAPIDALQQLERAAKRLIKEDEVSNGKGAWPWLILAIKLGGNC
jgi:signal recognition particle subunit SRP68